jgi:hypothetical protein
MINQTNFQMSQAIHVSYNAKTNQMVSVQYRTDLEMYEVHLYGDLGRLSLSIMSMDRILEDRGNDKWDFLGTL